MNRVSNSFVDIHTTYLLWPNEKSEISTSCWVLAGLGLDGNSIGVDCGGWISFSSRSCMSSLPKSSSSRWMCRWFEGDSLAQPTCSKFEPLGEFEGLSRLSFWYLRKRCIGDVLPWSGVPGLLENGEVGAEWVPCLMFFLAVWCQVFSAFATWSLKIVGFILEPIC